MLKHLVNDNDRTSLVNALQVAKLQYLADAKTTRGNARIAAQFERQAKDCDRLMALIIVEG